MTSGTASTRSAPNPLRRGFVAACRFMVRAMGYFSPGLVRFFHHVSADVAGEFRKSHHLRSPRIDLEVDDVRFSLDASRAATHIETEYQKLAESGEIYEPVMTRCLSRLLKQMHQPRFMDLGAFIGYYACYATALLEDAEPVYAVESNTAYCEGIRQSVLLNGFRNLKVYNAILSDTRESAATDGVTVTFGGGKEATQTTVTLDELCREESIQPDIIKMDVHGSEGKILFGMRELMRNSMEYLLLELHPFHYLERFSPGFSRTDILDLFDQLGLHVFYVSGHRIENSQKSRDCIRSGNFAYKRVTPENRDLLLFDRQGEVFLLVTRRADLAPVMGESLFDPFLC